MNDLFAIASWLEALRDTSAVIVALAGAVVAVSAAAKAPLISRPVHYIGRTFFAKPIERWLTRFLNEHQGPIHDTINATAAKVDETAAKVDDLDGRLQAIEHEVTPNGGSSLRDAVVRNESHVQTIETELRQLLASLASSAPQPQAGT